MNNRHGCARRIFFAVRLVSQEVPPQQTSVVQQPHHRRPENTRKEVT
jgi:hypothetical protein